MISRIDKRLIRYGGDGNKKESCGFHQSPGHLEVIYPLSSYKSPYYKTSLSLNFTYFILCSSSTSKILNIISCSSISYPPKLEIKCQIWTLSQTNTVNSGKAISSSSGKLVNCPSETSR